MGLLRWVSNRLGFKSAVWFLIGGLGGGCGGRCWLWFDELCDIVFGQFLLVNMWRLVPYNPVWDVITHTLNA